jgi:hypothetical protein
MVQADGIAVRIVSTPAKNRTLSPTGMVAYLEKLPSADWPYGLVVAVAVNGVRVPGDDDLVRKNQDELLRLLGDAGVRVRFWPSG